jgi:hypothetical protein
MKVKMNLRKDESGIVTDPIVMLGGAAVIVVLLLVAYLLGMIWDIVGGGMLILAFAVAMQFTPLKGWIGVAAGLIIGVCGLVLLGIL